MSTTISFVADTALWVAAFRALESDRPDAAFKDPFARRLAGERGFEMVRISPHARAMHFAMTIRTSAIDRLVQTAIARGIDTVINLGAGLDARPYRMQLPDNLRWIEVDFPNMITYKTGVLANERPVCMLQRLTADLTNDDERRHLFTGLSRQTKKALVITEGLIGYLSNHQAGKLSKELFAIPSFYYWVQDYNQGKWRAHRRARALRKMLVNAPLQFNVADPIRWFTADGWKVHENIHILDEADRIGRKMPLLFPWNLLMTLFPKKFREMGNSAYGYVMYGR